MRFVITKIFCVPREAFLRRGATVECSDEPTTILTVAPRLGNHSLPQPALKRRPKFNRRSATKNKSVH